MSIARSIKTEPNPGECQRHSPKSTPNARLAFVGYECAFGIHRLPSWVPLKLTHKGFIPQPNLRIHLT